MGDDISCGNGFQEYLMVKGIVGGFEGKWVYRSNRFTVSGECVDKEVQHLKKPTLLPSV